MDQPLVSAPAIQSNADAATFSRQGATAIITLPPAGLSNTPAFLEVLLNQMQTWARSPDVYAIVVQTTEGAQVSHDDVALGTPDAAQAGVAQQLSTFWGIDCLPKPILSMLDGQISNPFIGLTAFVTHRVASETCQFAWPAAGDSTAPPLGGLVHALARIPLVQATEWALTARGVGSAEAWAAGLVTHCIPRAEFPAIIAALAEAQPIDPILDTRHSVPALSRNAPDDNVLDRCFGRGSDIDILAALRRESGPHAAWAAAAAAAIVAQPPLALAGVQRLLAKARSLGRRDSLIMSHRLAVGLHRARGGAVNPSHHDPVLNSDIERLFEVPETGDLVLPYHAEIETGRF